MHMYIYMCRPIKYRWVLEWEPEDLASEIVHPSQPLPSTISIVMIPTSVALALTSLMSLRIIFLTTNQKFLSRNPTGTSNFTRSNCNSPVCMHVRAHTCQALTIYFQTNINSAHSYFTCQTQLKYWLFWELSMTFLAELIVTLSIFSLYILYTLNTIFTFSCH